MLQTPYPGCAAWLSFISTHWTPIWCMSSRITTVFTAHNLHPIQIMIANNNLNKVPSSNSWIPLVIDDVGCKLFGVGEGVTDSSGQLLNNLWEPTRQICQRVWSYSTRSIHKKKKTLIILQSQAEGPLKGMNIAGLTSSHPGL